MERIKIGNTDLEVARINLGGNVFGWTLGERESFEILDAFTDAGFNFIDTADIYSHWVDGGAGGQSETIIGNWLQSRQKRDDVIIATKVGGASGVHPVDTSKEHILSSVDKSLQRLKTDYIDLYYTHFDDEKITVEETLEAYDSIIKAGKVRYIAASNLSPQRLTASLNASEKNGLPKYEALQPHYSLVERTKYETDSATLAEKYNLTVFPYYSLASGFLSGKYRSEADFGKSVRGKGASKYLNKKGFGILAAIDKVSAKHSTTQTSVALAWLLAQPNIGAPIVSATNLSQLESLLAAPDLNLDNDDLRLLDEASK